jgi:hypothetical protein
LAEATQQNRAEIREIRKELRDLTGAVGGAIHELRTLRSDQQHEIEKLALRLENEMLRFERRLPPAKRNR